MMVMDINVNVPIAQSFPNKAFNLHAVYFILLIHKGHS